MERDEASVISDLLEKLEDICGEMGWSIAILGGKDDETVDGLIIGTDDFVKSAVGEQNEEEFTISGKKSTVTH